MPELLERASPPQAGGQGPAAPPAAAPSPARRVAPRERDAQRLAREELRRQIGELELRLGELFATAFPRKGIGFSVPAAGGPRVLGIGELERVRDALAMRLRDTQRELEARVDAEEENRATLERMIADPTRFHWLRISNEDIGEAGCRHWHTRPRWGPIGMLLGWWRVKLSSGCPLAPGRGPSASRPNKSPPGATG